MAKRRNFYISRRDISERHTDSNINSEPQYKGKPIIPTKTALYELDEIGMDLLDVVEVLTHGVEIRKRAGNIVERCVKRKGRLVNVVLVEFDNYYKLIHAGTFTFSKKFKEYFGENKDGI